MFFDSGLEVSEQDADILRAMPPEQPLSASRYLWRFSQRRTINELR